jgi:hypothetical protein
VIVNASASAGLGRSMSTASTSYLLCDARALNRAPDAEFVEVDQSRSVSRTHLSRRSQVVWRDLRSWYVIRDQKSYLRAAIGIRILNLLPWTVSLFHLTRSTRVSRQAF